MTLTGQPDWKVLLWNWERSKLLAITEIGMSGPIPRSPDTLYNFQLSYNPYADPNFAGGILLTGP